MAGIDNVKLVLAAVAEAGTATGKIYEDGEVTLGDIRYVPALLKAVKELGAANYKEVLPEAKDISDEEKQELSVLFKEKFDLPSDSVEEVVEQGLDILLMAVQAILSLADIFKKVKKPAVEAPAQA